VAIISFGFGYFVFRSQTNEQIRLEVYRRRLNAYEKIVQFLDDLDFFSHRSFSDKASDEFSEEEKDSFVKRAFQLSYSTRIYLPFELSQLVEEIYNDIDGLPDSLANLEEADEKIHHLIEKDIGKHLPNWRSFFLTKDDAGRKFDDHFSN